jgi:hypothetical protein
MASKTRIETSPQLVAFMAAANRKTERRRRAARLSVALLRLMQIHPQGIDVVCFLADSRHQTNESAMRTWALDQLDDAGFEEEVAISSELEVLLARLRATLNGLDASNDF